MFTCFNSKFIVPESKFIQEQFCDLEIVYHIEGASTSSHGPKGVTGHGPKAAGLNGPKAKNVKFKGSKDPGLQGSGLYCSDSCLVHCGPYFYQRIGHEIVLRAKVKHQYSLETFPRTRPRPRQRPGINVGVIT